MSISFMLAIWDFRETRASISDILWHCAPFGDSWLVDIAMFIHFQAKT